MTAAHATEEPIDVQGAAKYLGMSANWVYRRAEDKTLPGRKLGHKWRFFRSELAEWLKKGAPGQCGAVDQGDQG